MVIVKIQGGLGNQMFQFAIANIISNKNNSKLKLDCSDFELDNENTDFASRKFSLPIFDVSIDFASLDEINKMKEKSTFTKIKKMLGICHSTFFSEPSFAYQKRVNSLKPPIYLEGYFQSCKYFENNEISIQKLFSFKESNLDEKNIHVLKSIQNLRTTVAVHVRRGDYIKDKEVCEFHGVCDKEYYLKSIEFLKEKLENFTLVFFSDDIGWVKNNFNLMNFSTIFVEGNNGTNAWKDMFLMSSCTHQIIANSSFSWWGAWLNKNKNKIVISPKQWFANEEMNAQTKDLIPTTWLKF